MRIEEMLRSTVGWPAGARVVPELEEIEHNPFRVHLSIASEHIHRERRPRGTLKSDGDSISVAAHPRASILLRSKQSYKKSYGTGRVTWKEHLKNSLTTWM